MIWTSEFEFGIPIIDRQHKVLIEILNRLFDLANVANHMYMSKNETEILKILIELKNYTDFHFKYEENLFEKYQYLHQDSHTLKHESFKNHLAEIHSKLALDFNFIILMDLCYFINDWIIQHIMIEDYGYVQLFEYYKKEL